MQEVSARLVRKVVRRGVGRRGLRIADAVAGLEIMGFGGMLGWQTFRHG